MSTTNILKHYLGTGLKVVTNDDNETMLFHGLSGDNTAELVEIETVGTDKEYCRLSALDEFKPVMRSWDQLTKEIEHNGEKFVPMDYFRNECDSDYFADTDFEQYIMDSLKSDLIKRNIVYLPFGLVQKLIEFHFNIFNIPEELIILKE